MQYQIKLTISDAEDIFELAELLAPIKDNPKIKFAEAVPRPVETYKPAQERIEAARAARKPQLTSSNVQTTK